MSSKRAYNATVALLKRNEKKGIRDDQDSIRNYGKGLIFHFRELQKEKLIISKLQ